MCGGLGRTSDLYIEPNRVVYTPIVWLGHVILRLARAPAPQGSAPRGKIENTPAALEYARDDPRGCVVCVDNLELDTPREQPACRSQDTLPEGTARAAQLAPSAAFTGPGAVGPRAQSRSSRRIYRQKCDRPSLSDDERHTEEPVGHAALTQRFQSLRSKAKRGLIIVKKNILEATRVLFW